MVVDQPSRVRFSAFAEPTGSEDFEETISCVPLAASVLAGGGADIDSVAACACATAEGSFGEPSVGELVSGETFVGELVG